MGMYALIEDARTAALDAANCWHESDEAKALLAKLDGLERCADSWLCEENGVATAFTEAAKDAEDELEQLRYDAVNAAADAITGTIDDRLSDDWLAAWDEADTDAPPVKQIVQQARRNHAGDEYLRRFAA